MAPTSHTSAAAEVTRPWREYHRPTCLLASAATPGATSSSRTMARVNFRAVGTALALAGADGAARPPTGGLPFRDVNPDKLRVNP